MYVRLCISLILWKILMWCMMRGIGGCDDTSEVGMTARLLRTLVTLAVSVILIVVAVATAGPAAAAIPDRTFQLLGCNVGDYSCFYGKLGGSPYGYYCSNGYYTCTNGIPDTPPQNQQN